MLPIVTAFKTYLQNTGYSKGSVQQHTRSVASFFGYHDNDGAELKAVTTAQISSFYEWLGVRPNTHLGGGLGASTIYSYVQGLRVFFGWLEGSGQLPQNPMSPLYFKKGAYNRREPLSKEETAALFSAATTDKERALLHLLYSCGLRHSEALMLCVEDVHHNARMLYVRRGKGCKRRAVPLTDKVSDALEIYVLTGRVAPVGERAFLINSHGKTMSKNTSGKTLKALVQRAGLERIVTPHYLRHSIATHLLEAGVAIEQVKDFLGHRALVATQLYTQVYTRQLKDL